MSLYTDIVEKRSCLSVVGLGYVGLPIAVAFSEKVDVIGFDISNNKINLYKNGVDPTREIGDKFLAKSKILFTSDEKDLKKSNFHIIAVPTPINQDKTPDLEPVKNASIIVGRNLHRGSIVVYESTVYPGVTEDICIPLLEKASGLKCGIDFKVGYSPERINPGDKVHRIDTITKIVSGVDKASLDEIEKIYSLIISGGVYRAPNIKVAEAAKVVENSQRDINIAFMNELAMVFDKMGIDTKEVINAMNTKWNALGFCPGLVGGHCIGVDPYYFIYEAEKLGYHSQIILAGRKVNDGMGNFIGDAIIKELSLAGKVICDARVAILGLTFKENCPDIRNSKVSDIYKRLQEFGISPIVTDCWTNEEEVRQQYGITISDINSISNMDCIVLAVSHNEYRKLSIECLDRMFAEVENSKKVIIDVKNILNRDELQKLGYRYWSL